MKKNGRMLLLLALLMISANPVFAADKQDPQKSLPQEKESVVTQPELAIVPSKTALLVMDYQNDIVGMIPEADRSGLLARTGAVLKEARKAKIAIIYVAVRFRQGYPEINPQNKLFSSLKESGRFVEGTPGADIAPSIAPQPGDIVVTKRRVGAFSTTDLETILRSHNINKLVLSGISTSGVVLSTVRWAADMDYSLVVLSDLCADFDPEVNRILMEKVFPRQTAVMSGAKFLKAIGAKD